MTFGQALAAARIAAGLSTAELGELMGTDRSTVYHWELGSKNPIASHYDQLVDLFPALKFAPRPDSRDQEKPGPAPAPKSARKPRVRSKPAVVVPIREAPCDCAELRLSCGLCRPLLARAV
ncbi:helix-turn-helix domain-containing protein [Sorangium sp. So ce542]|uniref:helix-turn-helix domain-containing protein n=1 Tax=Sorangium sp. So ce542 TaxID=3133316 RepID=UPI003F601345